MLFLADIKAVFINSSCSSVFPHSYIKRIEQAPGVVQLMPEGPLRHLQVCLFNNAKTSPKVLSPTSDNMDGRSPTTATTPVMAAAEDEDHAGRSKCASLRCHRDTDSSKPPGGCRGCAAVFHTVQFTRCPLAL